ncbi:MAG: hypothetical protein ACT4PT_08700, partial [Methanobacteriota archaeon]
SEGTQVLFGRENPWIGVVAAGLLVFALAPLQKVADRIANAAVPQPGSGMREAGSGGRASKLDVYRATARRLLADGRFSREDERTLARLAQELGIGAADALDVREALEREAR